MGPPSPPPKSVYILTAVDALRPRALRESERFAACMLGLVFSVLKLPENLLPPSLGTMLIWTPPVVDSAVPAVVSTTTSSKVWALYWKPPPLNTLLSIPERL